MDKMNEAAAEAQEDRDREEQHNTWESEKDEAAKLGMTVQELRNEKEALRIHEDETKLYEHVKDGIY